MRYKLPGDRRGQAHAQMDPRTLVAGPDRRLHAGAGAGTGPVADDPARQRSARPASSRHEGSRRLRAAGDRDSTGAGRLGGGAGARWRRSGAGHAGVHDLPRPAGVRGRQSPRSGCLHPGQSRVRLRLEQDSGVPRGGRVSGSFCERPGFDRPAAGRRPVRDSGGQRHSRGGHRRAHGGPAVPGRRRRHRSLAGAAGGRNGSAPCGRGARRRRPDRRARPSHRSRGGRGAGRGARGVGRRVRSRARWARAAEARGRAGGRPGAGLRARAGPPGSEGRSGEEAGPVVPLAQDSDRRERNPGGGGRG